MTAQAYCLHRSVDPSGPLEFRSDRHYLLYALSGTMRLEADGQRWTLPPARAALVAANHPISVVILTRMTSASVLFHPSFVPPPMRSLSVFDASPLFRELVGECRQWVSETRALPDYAQQLFMMLSTVAAKLSEKPSNCVMPQPSSAALKRAVALCEDQAHRPLSFAEIARASGQSQRALARRFSEEIGMSWGELLRRIRMIRAVESLATSPASVTEIALSNGYRSVAAFNVAFKSFTGLTPTEYRKSFREGAAIPPARQ